MLDVHFVEEDCAIFGKLNLTCTTHEHFNGSLWAKIGLEDFLQSFSCIDIDGECLSLSDNISVCVNQLETGHCLDRECI